MSGHHECDDLHEVPRGRVNKESAFDLGMSDVTAKLHRANLIQKMRSASIGGRWFRAEAE